LPTSLAPRMRSRTALNSPPPHWGWQFLSHYGGRSSDPCSPEFPETKSAAVTVSAPWPCCMSFLLLVVPLHGTGLLLCFSDSSGGSALVVPPFSARCT